MAFSAVAFHESISVLKLEELFRSDLSQVFSDTMACECPRCHARFAVFFHDSEDPDNPKYFQKIVASISDNCTSGNHDPGIQI